GRMASDGTGSGTCSWPGPSSPGCRAAAIVCRSSLTRAGASSIAPASSAGGRQACALRVDRTFAGGCGSGRALSDQLLGGGELAAELVDLSLAQAQAIAQLVHLQQQ